MRACAVECSIHCNPLHGGSSRAIELPWPDRADGCVRSDGGEDWAGSDQRVKLYLVTASQAISQRAAIAKNQDDANTERPLPQRVAIT